MKSTIYSARDNTLKAADYEPAIRTSFARLKELYPDAVFPDVYFVIGRMNTGGTIGRNALVIGTEMYGLSESFPKDSLSAWHRAVLSSPDGIPAIVAHELIHYPAAGRHIAKIIAVQVFTGRNRRFRGRIDFRPAHQRACP